MWKDIGRLELTEIPEPDPKPDQIKVKIAYCGICGGDPEIIAGHLPVAGKPPQVIGHEASGTIVQVGNAVRRFQEGDRVALYFRTPCGVCHYCASGLANYCQKPFFSAKNFAEYAIFKEGAVFPIPDDIPLDEAALTEPVSVALHAVDAANIHPGSTVAIIGAGPIGLLILQLAIKAGAARVLVSEPMLNKRQLAKQLGADVVVDPLTEDLEEISMKFTRGKGFEAILEVSGNLAVAKQVLSLTDFGATVVWVGVYPYDKELSLSPYYMYEKELTIRSTLRSGYTFPRAVAMLPKLKLREMITAVYKLDEIQQAFALHKEGKAVKILIQP